MKVKKGKAGSGVNAGCSIMEDVRFVGAGTDPRFQNVPKAKKKVSVDERFTVMLDPKSSFGKQAVSDKYGRKVKHSLKEDLSRFYDIREVFGQENDHALAERLGKMDAKDDTQKAEKGVKGEGSSKTGKQANSGVSSDPVSAKLRNQDLREAMIDWSSSSTSEDEEERDEAEEVSDAVDIAQPVVPVTEQIEPGEETLRLAVVNMDWTRVKAHDLLMLLRSFCPSNGEVHHVSIFQSEFGKQRMEEERHHGPGRFLHSLDDQVDSTSQDEDEVGQKTLDVVKLRRYEADKLRYYYAVAKCDSARTAKTIYSLCDGVEYEASSNVVDLRYIPDEEIFDEEPYSFADGVIGDYQSPYFTNKAIGHTNVKMTWDENDPTRDVLNGKGLSGGRGKRSKNVQDLQIIDYTPFLAISDEEESEDRCERTRRRALLLGDGRAVDAFGASKDETESKDVIVTFQAGLHELGEKMLTKKQEREECSKLSVWQQYQKKKAVHKAGSKEKRREFMNGAEEEALDLPDGSEFVDDSYFKTDPFFRLPEDADSDQEDLGIWNAKKGEGSAGMTKEEEEMVRREKQPVNSHEQVKLELLMIDDAGTKRGYSLKHGALGRASECASEQHESRKKSKKNGKEKYKKGLEAEADDRFSLNLQDPRFASVYTDPKFALDPTEPHFLKTHGACKLLEEGLQRRSFLHASDDEDEARPHKAKVVGVFDDQKRPAKKGRLEASLATMVSTLKARER